MEINNFNLAILLNTWFTQVGNMLNINMFNFTTNDGKKFTYDYIFDLIKTMDLNNLPVGLDSCLHFLIDEDTKLVSVIDDETWCNDPKDTDLTFNLDLPDLYFTIHI